MKTTQYRMPMSNGRLSGKFPRLRCGLNHSGNDRLYAERGRATCLGCGAAVVITEAMRAFDEQTPGRKGCGHIYYDPTVELHTL